MPPRPQGRFFAARLFYYAMAYPLFLVACAAVKLSRDSGNGKMILLSWLLIALGVPLLAADYAAPAGTRPAIRRPGAPSILPGGRIIAPAGRQFVTGPGPFGLAISPDGKTVMSVNSGPERFSLTLLESNKKGGMTTRHLVAAPPRREDDG